MRMTCQVAWSSEKTSQTFSVFISFTHWLHSLFDTSLIYLRASQDYQPDNMLFKSIAVLSPLVSSVAAHGWLAYVSCWRLIVFIRRPPCTDALDQVTANGVNHTNYNPSVDPYKNPDPASVGWVSRPRRSIPSTTTLRWPSFPRPILNHPALRGHLEFQPRQLKNAMLAHTRAACPRHRSWLHFPRCLPNPRHHLPQERYQRRPQRPRRRRQPSEARLATLLLATHRHHHHISCQLRWILLNRRQDNSSILQDRCYRHHRAGQST